MQHIKIIIYPLNNGGSSSSLGGGSGFIVLLGSFFFRGAKHKFSIHNLFLRICFQGVNLRSNYVYLLECGIEAEFILVRGREFVTIEFNIKSSFLGGQVFLQRLSIFNSFGQVLGLL